MADLPSAPGEGPITGPPSSPQWAPMFPPPRAPRPHAWSAIALAAVAILLGATALVVALTRPTSSQSRVTSITSTAPSYSPEQTAAAHQQLCDAYSRAARAVQIESNGGGTALARIAAVNGAVMLEATAGAPGLKPDERSAALSLARTYRDLTAVGSVVNGSDDPAWQAAVGDVNAADGAMKKLCGAG